MGRMTHRRESAPPQRPHPRIPAPSDSALPTVKVSGDLEASLANGHPWIYRDHLPAVLDVEPGSWVRITSNGWTGIGICDPTSALAVRVYSRDAVPDAAWFAASVGRA